jgi:dTDP-4-dehydrorhamnose reductase
MLGRAVASLGLARGDRVVALDHQSLDITDAAKVDHWVQREQPEVIINCAAWTDVDGCERDPARAQSENGAGPEFLAQAARKAGAQLITISTDYVFDGEKDGFYTQRDQPNPQSAYGLSKLEGERRAQIAWANTIVVRSGYIFGPGGKNFLSTLIVRARRGEALKAIDDSFGTPTYAPHLAAQLYRLSEVNLPGIYHIVNAGEGTSFAGFARAALETCGLSSDSLQTVSLDDLKRPARRPRNSRLRCVLSEALGLDALPEWRTAIREFAEFSESANPTPARTGTV